MSGILQGMIAPHSPRIAVGDRVTPPFELMRDGLYGLADELSPEVEVAVLVSCHFLTTFLLYVDGAARHRGILTATECPDLVTSLPYDFLGMPKFASRLAQKAEASGIPLKAFDNDDFVLDYGTVVPAQYILPRRRVPLVPISVSLVGTLDEAVALGRVIAETARDLRVNAAVIASGALSHRVVRGPERWPLDADRERDRAFLEVLSRGDTARALDALPDFAETAHVEAAGKHLGCLLGSMPKTVAVEVGPYGPSSGSGNASVLLQAS